MPGYLRPRDNRVLAMLALPFTAPRPYWRWPSGQVARRVTTHGLPDRPGVMAA